MSPNVNNDGSIRSEVRVKAERPKMVTSAWGSSPSDWGHEIRQKRMSSLLVLAVVRKVVIVREMEKYWYGSHVMDGSGFLMVYNVERSICRCASSRSGSGVESVAPKSEEFRTIFRRHLSSKLVRIVDG